MHRIKKSIFHILFFGILLVFSSPLAFAQFTMYFDEPKNFVIHHYSANKKYELYSIPVVDILEGPTYVYVGEISSRRCLYTFMAPYNNNHDLFLLSNDGKTVYQFYANLNGQVSDPQIREAYVYHEGIITDTIKNYFTGFLNFFSYAHKVKNIPKYNYRNKGSITIWGDTLKFLGYKNREIYCFYSSLNKIPEPFSPEKKTKKRYRNLFYDIRFMNAYERDKLYEHLEKKD